MFMSNVQVHSSGSLLRSLLGFMFTLIESSTFPLIRRSQGAQVPKVQGPRIANFPGSKISSNEEGEEGLGRNRIL